MLNRIANEYITNNLYQAVDSVPARVLQTSTPT